MAGDPEQLARLEREALMLVALDHPNIATVYGLEQAGRAELLEDSCRVLSRQVS